MVRALVIEYPGDVYHFMTHGDIWSIRRRQSALLLGMAPSSGNANTRVSLHRVHPQPVRESKGSISRGLQALCGRGDGKVNLGKKLKGGIVIENGDLAEEVIPLFKEKEPLKRRERGVKKVKDQDLTPIVSWL